MELTFARVFGPDVVHNPRVAWNGYHMLRRGDEAIRDMAPTGYVTITGGSPMICPRSGLTDAARDLMTSAGLPWPEQTLPYTTAAEYQEVLRGCVTRSRRVAFEHAHPTDPELDPLYWIPRDLLILLNDKAELTRFVPAEDCPPRKVMTPAEAAALPYRAGTTMVFKGSTPMSTGSGGAVVIARGEAEVRSIGARLGGCERVVVEEFQAFTRTMCINWAADNTGTLHFIGSADQIVDAEGVYVGSWVGASLPPPEPALHLAREVMNRAVKLGYVGYAGVDVGILPDGRPLAFDLNFRLCGSTTTLLWFPLARDRLGPDCHARLVAISALDSFEELCRTARRLAEDGILLPLGAFDPSRSAWPGRRPLIRAAVLGRNRAETEARCEALSAQALTLR